MIDPVVRRRGIGGSEIAALFGVDEYKSAFSVWLDKKGIRTEGDHADEDANDRMMMGRVLEPAVLELYSRMTHRAILSPHTSYQHPDWPFMVWSPDALVVGEKRGVEAKVAFMEQRRKWGWEADAIPLRVQFQCFWYMAATDYPVWDVVAFLGDGLPRIYTLTRLDAAHERAMLQRAEEWWQRYIVGDEQPGIDDSDAAGRWLVAAYPAHRPNSIREATEEEAQLLRHYIIVRIAAAKLEATRKAQEVAIKQAIADGEGLRWDESNLFTWRKSKDSSGTDWEAMATALLYNFVKEPEARQELYERFAITKQGTRRINVSHPMLKKDGTARIQPEQGAEYGNNRSITSVISGGGELAERGSSGAIALSAGDVDPDGTTPF